MLAAPPINTPITLDVVGWTAPLGSRVEELDDVVAVADPLLGADDHDPSLGASVTLSWNGERGPCEMPTILVGKELGKVRMWRLQPDGPVVITQRRHHVRISTLLPLTIRTGSSTFEGHLVDLSEGGIRSVCALPPHVTVGDRLSVRFQVEAHTVDVDAAVVRLDHHDDHACAGCRFVDTPARDADIIRRFVFDRQVKERRLRDGR